MFTLADKVFVTTKFICPSVSVISVVAVYSSLFVSSTVYTIFLPASVYTGRFLNCVVQLFAMLSAASFRMTPSAKRFMLTEVGLSARFPSFHFLEMLMLVKSVFVKFFPLSSLL